MAPNPYDTTPYTSNPFPQSHPDRLATLATLFGLSPPSVASCRVLEIGCAGGGNLVPMAAALPGSRFVGIDLSERQIAEAQRFARCLGLTNIDLRRLDLNDFDDPEPFDYVLCHGVYSWVPPAAQDRILALCGRLLSPDGVAYVSYNTMPGWGLRGIVREMMLFHAGPIADPAHRAQEARSLLGFFAHAFGDGPYAAFLRSEFDGLQHHEDSYLLHDHLEENNHPVYFHEFMRRAAGHGLAYLGDSSIQTMVPSHFPPEVETVLQRIANDTLRLEQFMDFARNRTFRQTLLCRADKTPCHHIRPQNVARLHVASPMKPAPKRDDRPGYAAFETPDGVAVSSCVPIVRASLRILCAAWPRRLPFAQLLDEARKQIGKADGGNGEPDDIALGRALLQFHTGTTSAIEVSTLPLDAVAKAERPKTSAVAQWLAREGRSVTSLRHESVGLDGFTREIVQRLDGRTHDELLVALDGLSEKPADVRQALSATLEKLGRASLLVG